MQILRRHFDLLIRGRERDCRPALSLHPRHIEPPLAIFSVLPLSLFAFSW
jgi:hypothetical protein